MAPIPLRLSWRSWWRWIASGCSALAFGIVAAAADPAWYIRLVAAAVFVLLVAALLDVVVFARSWEVDGRRWWVPTLLSRGRIIPVDDQLVVELVSSYPARLRIVGERGTRDVVLNPLMSVRDLGRWFDAIAG